MVSEAPGQPSCWPLHFLALHLRRTVRWRWLDEAQAMRSDLQYMNLIFSHSNRTNQCVQGPVCLVWNKMILLVRSMTGSLILPSPHSGHFSSSLAQTNFTLAQHMTTSSKTASHNRLFSPHPCSAELWDLLFCLSVFTGPPGKRGRMGRRGEPGKWRSPPALFVYFSFLSLSLDDPLFLPLSPLSLLPWVPRFCFFFLADWINVQAGKVSDRWVSLVDDGPHLGPLPYLTICTDTVLTLAMWLY